jgi:hypothetical protein
MLIKGQDLNYRQRQEVLSAFLYRWTTGNKNREALYADLGHRPPTIPLQTDDEWLKEHAFHFVKDGSRLMFNRHHAEPVYMADPD